MKHWTIELKRDADYWEDEVTVKDDDGSVVTFSDSWITFHPDTLANGAVLDPVIWSKTNLKLIIPSDGSAIGFNVSMEEIAAYEWDGAEFCWAVIYTNGKRDFSWMTGRVTVREACL
jgi:hypothetical protein